jgi:inorganic pyrophosphatase
MELSKILPLKNDRINVIIETPRDSVYKYDYCPELRVFELNKIMPLGMVFPFDFGFIPNTRGGDGDPLDVLLLMDHPIIQGSLVCCRPLALLEAKQKERNGNEERNDRIIATSEFSKSYPAEDFIPGHSELLQQIETFFKEYNKLAGKEFTPLRWQTRDGVFDLIKKSII